MNVTLDTDPPAPIGIEEKESVIWPQMRRIIAQAEALHKEADDLAKGESSDKTNGGAALPDDKDWYSGFDASPIWSEKFTDRDDWSKFWKLFTTIAGEHVGRPPFRAPDSESSPETLGCPGLTSTLEGFRQAVWDELKKNATAVLAGKDTREKLKVLDLLASGCCFRLGVCGIRESGGASSASGAVLSIADEALKSWEQEPLESALDGRISSALLHITEAGLLHKHAGGNLGKSLMNLSDWLKTHRQSLLRELEACVSQAVEEAKPFRISMLLRLLGGRYLNEGLTGIGFAADQLDSNAWGERRAIDNGLRAVLASQHDNGVWDRLDFVPRSPLTHGYSPLLHILDLDTPVLMHRLRDVMTATERAITSIASRMDVVQRALRSKGSFDPIDGHCVLWLLVEAYSVGLMVADRFKDLLSDCILMHFGASTTDDDKIPETIADALSLSDSLTKGVIDKWKYRHTDRPGAILLFGPPGTGKTTVAKWLARELDDPESLSPGRDWKFVEFTPADFAREGTDGIVAQADRIFTLLKDVRRCVVLLDEMEEFMRSRTDENDRISRLITTAFLPLLQKVHDGRELVLVVATNYVGSIDPAIIRPGRFDLILPLGPPDEESREDWFMERLWEFADHDRASAAVKDMRDWNTLGVGVYTSRARELEEMLDWVAKLTMGYSISELRSVSDEILREAFVEDTEDSPAKFLTKLWDIRSQRPPLALSGRSELSWDTFIDEAERFARYPQETESDKKKDPNKPKADGKVPDKYKEPPVLPKAEFRMAPDWDTFLQLLQDKK